MLWRWLKRAGKCLVPTRDDPVEPHTSSPAPSEDIAPKAEAPTPPSPPKELEITDDLYTLPDDEPEATADVDDEDDDKSIDRLIRGKEEVDALEGDIAGRWFDVDSYRYEQMRKREEARKKKEARVMTQQQLEQARKIYRRASELPGRDSVAGWRSLKQARPHTKAYSGRI